MGTREQLRASGNGNAKRSGEFRQINKEHMAKLKKYGINIRSVFNRQNLEKKV